MYVPTKFLVLIWTSDLRLTNIDSWCFPEYFTNRPLHSVSDPRKVLSYASGMYRVLFLLPILLPQRTRQCGPAGDLGLQVCSAPPAVS